MSPLIVYSVVPKCDSPFVYLSDVVGSISDDYYVANLKATFHEHLEVFISRLRSNHFTLVKRAFHRVNPLKDLH